MRRLVLGISTLVALLLLFWASAGWASGEMMTLARFRQHPREARIYMVLGALNVTNAVDMICPVPVTVGELEAALVTRTLSLDKAWVQTMIELMGERGCVVNGERPNA